MGINNMHNRKQNHPIIHNEENEDNEENDEKAENTKNEASAESAENNENVDNEETTTQTTTTKTKTRVICFYFSWFACQVKSISFPCCHFRLTNKKSMLINSLFNCFMRKLTQS